MNADETIKAIDDLIHDYWGGEPKPEPEPEPPGVRVVTPEMDLQAELNIPGPIGLVAGGNYPGVTLPSGTELYGNGARIVGTGNKPALYVTPGSSKIYVENVVCLSDYQSVIVLGDNDKLTQNLTAQVPADITLISVKVPTHRRKRGFEINAARVLLDQCEVHDCYDQSAGADSAGIGILNSPGGITVRGGVFEAGSHPVLLGGDEMKLTDHPVIEDCTFDGCLFTRPAAWQTDGVNHRVKTIFEVKNGRRITVRHCTMENVWTAAQTGVALMLTPTRGGVVQDLLFEDCVVRNCAAGVSINGSDVNMAYTPEMWTGGLTFRRCNFTISRAQYTGSGRFMLCDRGPKTVDVEDCLITMDSTSVIYVTGTPLMDRLRVVDSTFNCGQYGIMIAGGANCSSWAKGVVDLTVVNNTMSGAASALRNNLAAIGKTPANAYV